MSDTQIKTQSTKSLPALQFLHQALLLANQKYSNINELRQNKTKLTKFPCQKLKAKIVTLNRIMSEGKGQKDELKKNGKLLLTRYKTYQDQGIKSLKSIKSKKSLSVNLPKLSKVCQQSKQSIQSNKSSNTNRQIQRLRTQKLAKGCSILQNSKQIKERFGKLNKNNNNQIQKRRGIMYYTYLGQKIQNRYNSPRNNPKFVLDIKKSIGKISDHKLQSPNYIKQILNDKKDAQNNLIANQFQKNQVDRQKELIFRIKNNLNDKCPNNFKENIE